LSASTPLRYTGGAEQTPSLKLTDTLGTETVKDNRPANTSFRFPQDTVNICEFYVVHSQTNALG